MTSSDEKPLRKTLFIVDGNSYLHRAYHALPPLTTSLGEQINAVYGFVRMFLKLLKTNKPDLFAVCFDTPEPTFRHKEYSAYKKNRKETEVQLKNQMPMAREALDAFSLKYIEKAGFEADDLIATLAETAVSKGLDVIILTADKDCMQLVNENVRIFDDYKNIYYDEEKVTQKYGVNPRQILDYFSMTGDSSDNVPGLKGVGEKTAVKLIHEFGNLDNILKNLDSLPEKLKSKFIEGRDLLNISRDLIKLKHNVPLEINIEGLHPGKLDSNRVLKFLQKIEATKIADELLPAATSETTCEIICDTKSFQKFLEKLSKSNAISLEMETGQPGQLNSSLLAITISMEMGGNFYIPLSHSYLGCPSQLDKEYVLANIKGFLENKNKMKYGQNIKHTLIIFNKEGISLSGIAFDPLIASYCINPAKTHKLKELAFENLGMRIASVSELVSKDKKGIGLKEATVEAVSKYSCTKSAVTLKLKPVMTIILKEKNLADLFEKVEMPLIEVLAAMERTGIKVDSDYLKKLDRQFTDEIIKLEKKIYEIAGEEFNLNSPKQLQVILFEKLKLPTKRRTKTGYSTDEEVLSWLSSQHPLPESLLRYRELQKLKSTYIDALLVLKDPQTGRVHTSFNQAVTTTGRLSSTNPNMQNIPVKSEFGQKIRQAFIADNGNLFVSADYSQIDLRVMAHISRDEVFINAFKNNEDIHTVTACEVLNLTPDKVDQNARRMAKTINFGIIYGISAFGLSQQLNIPAEQAQKIIDEYFKKYTGVKEWTNNIINFAREKGYVCTLLNRIRYIPEINSKNAQIRAFAERTAVNTPIQGTSADIIKLAMLNIHNKVLPGRNTKMLLQVHDDLLFEVPENEVSEIVPLIKNEMENSLKLSIPLVADIKIGKNWAEMSIKVGI